VWDLLLAGVAVGGYEQDGEMSRPNPARRLALVATCPECRCDRRVTHVSTETAQLAICGHVVDRGAAH
jgi:hypothetical protein